MKSMVYTLLKSYEYNNLVFFYSILANFHTTTYKNKRVINN